MPNASTTQASSASNTTGAAIPLSYGYVWATGKRAEYYMTQNTNNTHTDYWRAGIWLLGHGEWDGCNELWINDQLTYTSEFDDPTRFHFHRGSDATIGAGLAPVSSGPEQGVDTIFTIFPSAINALAYNRIAYYSIYRKQPIQYQTNDHQGDPSQWTDVNPIGLWRALRTRLFDDTGKMSGYAFNTNPAWHFVDVLLRRKIMPDYNIDLNNGPDDLTPAVRARFDWGSIYEAAAYFDGILSNGRRRFEGNYAFAAQTSLQAVLEQILLCCRSYMQEAQGKIYLVCDKPRPSIFTFSRDHVLPGSFDASDKALHTTANRYISKFRDLLVPAASEIAGITCADHRNPVVTTVQPHPFASGDRIAIGGTATVYDGTWVVNSVPTGSNVTTFTMNSKGSNYPANVGAGGSIGLLYSRFKERAPEFWHKKDQLGRGAIGLGIPRFWNKVKQQLDFATCTYDQVSRITRYERDRQLGHDVTPYVTPPHVRLKTSMFAKDVNGNLACAIQPGDHVTIDDTASWPYAGDYEVLEPLTIYPPTVEASSSGDALALRAATNSGEIEFTLGKYDESIMYDTSDDTQAGWPSVPGSDPGNEGRSTNIELSDGTAVFFTGALASGQVFQLPSDGFTPSNLLSWAGPQGFIDYGHPMHVILQCSADANRKLTLKYVDGENNQWPGDVNYAGFAWRSPEVPTVSGAMTWLALTLAGGEKILIGQGVVADGTTLVLPAGYTAAKSFAMAFPHDGVPTGNQAHGVAAYVDSGLMVHLNYQDGQGHVWHGNGAVLVFAWQDNMSTVVTSTVSGASWITVPLSTGSTLGVGFANLANGAKFALPPSAGDGSTLQAICSPSSFQIVDHPAHGVKACYLDANNNVALSFEDGEGHVWYGTADVFGLFVAPSSGVPVTVSISPLSTSIVPGATRTFVATVKGTTNTAVTWSVNGIAGGSVFVGTIDANGNYIGPSAAGYYDVKATSVVDATASAVAVISVGATLLSGNGLTINGS